MDWVFDLQIWISLLTLTLLEIVLGIDKIIVISIFALSFLLMIGVMLVADAFDRHIPRGYVYFAMVFSLGVEMLNIRARGRRAAPVQLHQPYC